MKLEIKEWECLGRMIKDHHIILDDVGEYWSVSASDAIRDKPNWDLFRDTSISASYTRWAGTESHEQAMDLAMNGWPEGEKIVEGLIQEIDPITTPQPDLVMSNEGLFIDVGEFLTGTPEYWMNETYDEQSEKTAKTKFIHVNVSIGYHSNVDGRVMLAHAAGISAAIKSIEASGVGVDLRVVDSACSKEIGGFVYSIITPIKTANEPLCLSRQAFCLGHPSMLRRIGIGVIESQLLDEIAPMALKRLGAAHGGPLSKRNPNKSIPCFWPDDDCSDTTKIRDRFIAYCREIAKEQGSQLAC